MYHKDKCIILVAHITNINQVTVLEKSIAGIRKHASAYPIVLVASGDVDMINSVTHKVNHFIITSLNKLHRPDRKTSALTIWFYSEQWKIERVFSDYEIPYYGYAQLQKTAASLQTAKLLGYNNFLVMNYDSVIMDDAFVDTLFTEQHSVFFGFEHPPVRMSSDVFKLNEVGANTLIDFTTNESLYLELSDKADAGMLEDILGLMLNRYQIPFTRYPAYNDRALQLYPFNVLINLMSNGNDCLAAIYEGKVYLLVTSMGHPIHSVNGMLEIECDGLVHKIDVSNPYVNLIPIVDYNGEDVNLVIRNGLGEFPITLKTTTLEKSLITYM